ncbi:uncharacterized protein Dana_GF24466 [Drosophila ananassae]|uniref:Chitin-binding type-2 domain-containing protein n=1 Tax=Drosophila ananassae TaxID=7217 RepID=B3M501_DROAN|nr:uncharacterized protein LOC6507098 [Drosophila ananassae]EDV39480.1 uncharacterized protein Dana_GF24466 [Drosophila ananassae]
MWQLILLACLLPGLQVRAAFLEDCKGVIIPKIPNENKECSQYVHCDGDNSYYCNGDCDEPVQCYQEDEEITTEAPPPTTTAQQTQEVSSEESTLVNTTTSTPAPPPETTLPPTTSNPITDARVHCRISGVNGVYPYPANSNYYYQCLGGFLLLQQCPQNFYFEAVQGLCISKKPYRSSVFQL